eukprot:scaffold91408_cov13-Tisochrysis_lutea.AAC.1
MKTIAGQFKATNNRAVNPAGVSHSLGPSMLSPSPNSTALSLRLVGDTAAPPTAATTVASFLLLPLLLL